MTLKTTKMDRDEVALIQYASAIGPSVKVPKKLLQDLCHDADRAEELEWDNNQRLRIIKEIRSENEELLDLIETMFIGYENGADCYEDPEEQSGYIGKAIKLDEAVEHRIAGILNVDRSALKGQEK